jgi:hypothetical protein
MNNILIKNNYEVMQCLILQALEKERVIVKICVFLI